ncbi:flavin reductase [Rhodococcus qingshengii]|uniref:flavin reductase n=1 Tax=Rhodococcus qingshengii TaxID=334542 RepID=UPI0010A608E7|nr:flavin reductase [Rhodococcus qingshengii]THJ67618.1 flavin reductase [Rhodococcus qingshengii]
MSNNINPSHFRQVMGQYPTGVVVISTTIPGEPVAALTIGSFSSVSLNPPLVAFYPDQSSSSWPKIHAQGRFTINVLSADQEALCRQFARKGADKFAGVSWHPAPSGSPLIEGATAWLDCELHDVQEVGDHYLVIARVTAMDSAANRLPLLFFRGGYGKFMPASLAAGEAGLADLLPAVDMIRPELERIAEECDSECLLASRVHDEFVVLASAGFGGYGHSATRVGRRLPYAAPMGAPLAAWGDPTDVARWVGPSSESDPVVLDEWQRALQGIRECGYVIGMGEMSYGALESVIDDRTSVGLDDDLAEAFDEVQRAMLNPPDITESEHYDVRSLSVPIFAAGDRVMQIGFYGLEGTTSGTVLTANIEHLLEAGRRCTQILGGTQPEANGGPVAAKSTEGAS